MILLYITCSNAGELFTFPLKCLPVSLLIKWRLCYTDIVAYTQAQYAVCSTINHTCTLQHWHFLLVATLFVYVYPLTCMLMSTMCSFGSISHLIFAVVFCKCPHYFFLHLPLLWSSLIVYSPIPGFHHPADQGQGQETLFVWYDNDENSWSCSTSLWGLCVCVERHWRAVDESACLCHFTYAYLFVNFGPVVQRLPC